MKGVAVGLFIGALAAGLPLAASAERGTVYLVGDSTMAPNTGYGNALCARLQPEWGCVNLARGGRSTLSYRAEGLWDALLQRLKAQPAQAQPPHVLIQFGHNDQPGKPGRSTDLATEYPANLQRYADEVRAAGAVPVLLTPLTRRSFKGDQLDDQLQPWADAMRRVAASRGVPLVELHALSMARVQPLGQAGADELAETAPGQPRFDRTHVGERGACVFSQIVLDELSRQVPALNSPRRALPACETLLPPALRFSEGGIDTRGWTSTQGGRGGPDHPRDHAGCRRPRIAESGHRHPGPSHRGLRGGRRHRHERNRGFDIRHPFLTIAGQTAPGPGITVIKAETVIRTHDVIVQHLRFRPGEFGRPEEGRGGPGRAVHQWAGRTTSSSTIAASAGAPTRTCRPRGRASRATRRTTGGAAPRTASPTATT